MSCAKGTINPSGVTKLRLFADSGAYYSSSACLSKIFVDFELRAYGSPKGGINGEGLRNLLACS
jgi:hypothetical protein